MLRDKILRILPLVGKPSRYIGGEINSIEKNSDDVKLRWALCFPDTYEIGISHLGLKVLYDALNSRPDTYAERAYSPWTDMEAALRERSLPLYTVETFTSLSDMDVVGFTLQYELSYTNILNMLDLADIPMYSRDRKTGPLVIAGGPCAFNPEPLADFIDAFVIGDAEDAVNDISEVLLRFKTEGGGRGFSESDRPALLAELSKIDGVYVPSHFAVNRNDDGTISAIKNIAGGPDTVRKRTVMNLENAVYPEKPILPFIAAIHNRVTLEISRGCPRGCRFCQAGYIYRPMRERSVDRLMDIAKTSICATGYEEMSLSSLSAGDYYGLHPLIKGMMDEYESRRVSISLPSLRVGSLTPDICREIKRVRKSGFTIAPEAGSQRLRDYINKNITEEALVETAETVFREGWDLIKLYFMIGLPSETDEDIQGIMDLSRKVMDAGRKAGGRRKAVNVGIAAFVPKPHTPYQWCGQEPLAEIIRKKDILKRVLGKKPFAVKTSHGEMSVLEAAFARGGREVGFALYEAWKAGARFDGWTEMFNWNLWKDAFTKAGLDAEAEAMRSYRLDDILPWDHIDSGVTKKFFIAEYERSSQLEKTSDCREKCAVCGLKCRLGAKGQGLEASMAGARDEGLGASEQEVAAVADDESVAGEPAAPAADPQRRSCSPARREGVKGSSGVSARIRIKYEKALPLALLSHTEIMTVLFRAISRAELPIMFSDGFNPHPKVSFGPALAVGIESEAEILDIELDYALNLADTVKKLNSALPEGIRILESRVLGKSEPAAGVGLKFFTYAAEAPQGMSDRAAELINAFLEKTSVPLTRKSDKATKVVDVRPMVDALEYHDGGLLTFTLKEHDGKSAKPFEIMQAVFELTAADARATRVKRLGMR